MCVFLEPTEPERTGTVLQTGSQAFACHAEKRRAFVDWDLLRVLLAQPFQLGQLGRDGNRGCHGVHLPM